MRYLLFFLFVIIISCKKQEPIQPESVYVKEECSFKLEELDPIVETPECNLQLSKLNYIRVATFGDNDTIFNTTFTIDNCGKVIEEIRKGFNNDYPSYDSEFKYNAEGRVIKELRNGVIYRYVEWVDNEANVYDKLCNRVGEFIFENDRVVLYKDICNTSTVTNILKYDNLGNLISIKDDRTGVPYEYLDFNLDIENPFYQLNSISILRFDLKPFMEYRHETEKRNEYTILDVHYTLTSYHLTYELDSIGRVITIDNSKYFYTGEFSYD